MFQDIVAFVKILNVSDRLCALYETQNSAIDVFRCSFRVHRIMERHAGRGYLENGCKANSCGIFGIKLNGSSYCNNRNPLKFRPLEYSVWGFSCEGLGVNLAFACNYEISILDYGVKAYCIKDLRHPLLRASAISCPVP